jgi:lipoprotein-anchoring transpeptidase ErfK/SrfK
MKRLALFSLACGLLLGSASPPDRAQPALTYDLGGMIEADCAGAKNPGCMTATSRAPPAPPPIDRRRAARLTSPTVVPAIAPVRGDALRVLISIPQQKAYVFQAGALVATSPVSTGKPGHPTPSGTFRILQKKVHHRSSKYSNAPMPYMQRLTDYGIALHAGRLPGYPASHGCIRLPWGFARKLYNMTDHSTRVTITRKRPRSTSDALTMA